VIKDAPKEFLKKSVTIIGKSRQYKQKKPISFNVVKKPDSRSDLNAPHPVQTVAFVLIVDLQKGQISFIRHHTEIGCVVKKPLKLLVAA
jgi:hypothetical protein